MDNNNTKINNQGFKPLNVAPKEESSNLDGSILKMGMTEKGLSVVGGSKELESGKKVYGINSFLEKLDFPHYESSDSGAIKLLGTKENLEHLIDSYNIVCRYNKISKSTEIDIRGQTFTVDNEESALLSELSSLCVRNKLPKSLPEDYILSIADKRSYNPIEEWINSKPWDGQDRISELIDTVVVKPQFEHLAKIYIKKWLMSAVAVLSNEGQLDYEGVLVFQGDQGLGKTKWIKRILPKPLRKYVDDGTVVEPRNKDTVFTACSHWIAELGELDATFKATDISDIKRFITKRTDKLRRPYARTDSNLPRRTVFFGSVNESAFLKDKTGNRRFWVLPTIELKSYDDMDVQQLWAQVAHELEKAGGCNPDNSPWYLTKEEESMRDEGNRAFTEMSPIEEMILEQFVEDEQQHFIRANATTVARIIGINNIENKHTREIGVVLKKYFGEPKSSGGVQKYKLPRPKDTTDYDLFGWMGATRAK